MPVTHRFVHLNIGVPPGSCLDSFLFSLYTCVDVYSYLWNCHWVSSVDPKPEVFPRDFQQAVGWVYILVSNAANETTNCHSSAGLRLCISTHDVRKKKQGKTQSHTHLLTMFTSATRRQVMTVMKEFIMQAAGSHFTPQCCRPQRASFRGHWGWQSPSSKHRCRASGCRDLFPTTCWGQRGSRGLGHAGFISGCLVVFFS